MRRLFERLMKLRDRLGQSGGDLGPCMELGVKDEGGEEERTSELGLALAHGGEGAVEEVEGLPGRALHQILGGLVHGGNASKKEALWFEGRL